MSDINELLDLEIYPRLQERAPQAFPEFGFARGSRGWKATQGEINGEKARDHLYYYDNAPYCFKHYKLDKAISILKYIQERDRLSYWESIKDIANRAGYTLSPTTDYSSEKEVKARERGEELEKALSYFKKCLREEIPLGKGVYDYLRVTRGYTETEIENMELGKFPSQKIARQALGDSLKSLGLDVWGDDHNLVIPYRDAVGRLKGLIARRIDKVTDRKYLFTLGLEIDTPINAHEARGCKAVYLVEGVLDALIATQRGLRGVIAIGRVSITEKQLQTLIRQGTRSIVVIPDNDEKGGAGAERSLESIQEAGLNAFVIPLPDEVKDLDEYLKRGGTIEELARKEISGAKWKAQRILLKHDTGTDRGRREALEEAIAYAETLREYMDAQDFLTIIKGGLNIPLEVLEERLGDYTEKKAKERLRGKLNTLARKLQEGEIADTGELEETVRALRLEHERVRVKPSMPYVEFLRAKHERDSKREGGLLGYRLNSFSEIARRTDGIQPGFYILGADTNTGKTAFLTNIFLELLFSNEQTRGIYFSFDDSREVISNRFVSILSRIDLITIQKKQTTTENRDKVSKVYGTLEALAEQGRLEVKDIAEVNHIDTLELIIRERAEENLFVVIDGLYNLDVGKSYGGIREENIDRANKIKALVDTYRIPIITTGEIRKRGANEKADRTPTVDDLMETGKFAYNANLVWMLYPKNYEDFKTNDAPTLVLEFVKNKLSYFRGMLYLTFTKAQGRIEEQVGTGL